MSVLCPADPDAPFHQCNHGHHARLIANSEARVGTVIPNCTRFNCGHSANEHSGREWTGACSSGRCKCPAFYAVGDVLAVT